MNTALTAMLLAVSLAGVAAPADVVIDAAGAPAPISYLIDDPAPPPPPPGCEPDSTDPSLPTTPNPTALLRPFLANNGPMLNLNTAAAAMALVISLAGVAAPAPGLCELRGLRPTLLHRTRTRGIEE